MIKRSSRSLAVLALASVSFMAACGGKSTTGGSDPKAPKEIVVAGVLPQTGASGAFGQMQWYGLQLAAELINEQGGIKSLGGAKIKAIVADTESKPEVAGTQTEKVIQQGAVAINGTNHSPATLVATQVAERNQVPFIVSSDIDPSITARGFKYTFRTQPVMKSFVEDMLNYIKQQGEKAGKKVTKIAFLSENSVVGKGSVKYGTDAAKALGFEVVEAIEYDATATQNFASYLSKFKEKGVEAVIGYNKAADSVMITRTFKELNYNPMVIGGLYGGHTSGEFVNALGPTADNILVAGTWSPEVKIEGQDTLMKRFEEKYKVKMDSSAAAGFSGMAIIWEALEKSGTTDRTKLREAISKVELKAGEKMYLFLGGVKFDPATGENNNAKGFVFTVKDKNWLAVYPSDYATTAAPWPKPNF